LRKLHWLALLLLPASMGLGGCTGIKYVLANLAPEMPGPKVPAQYEGLKGRTVAVVVYADMNMRFDYPTVREEVGGAINRELTAELKDTHTIDAQQVARYQDVHPGWRSEPLPEVGKKLGADSVLYISLSEFATQERGSLSLPKGRISGQVSVWDALPLKEGEDSCRWRQDSASVTMQPPPGTWMDRQRLRQVTQEAFAQQVVRYFHSYRLKNSDQ
jgi:hypothetical protein